MSTEEMRDRVRSAGESGNALRIHGAGGWLDAGRPVANGAPVSLAADDAIIEYVPGDLTLTARAGATLGEIARVTGAENQWLALDPFGSPAGTLGATIATASAGPLAAAFGTPRDAVLGLEVVTGVGEIVRSGGRVVKNVAGFDLTRLFTGAWGTLAIIAEATVRLRARPERDETVALAIPSDEDLEAWLGKLRALPFQPLALEVLSAALARALGLGGEAVALARLGGNDDSVRAQRQVLGAMAELIDAPLESWNALREIEPPHSAVARVSTVPSRLRSIWTPLTTGEHASSLVHATVGRGIVRTIYTPSSAWPIERWLAAIGRCEGTHIFERLPASAWSAVPSRVSDPLSRAVRAAFDPRHVLNRGILGEVA